MSSINDLINKKCKNKVPFYKLSEIGKPYNGLSGKSKSDFENGNSRYITYTNIYNNPSTRLDFDDFVKVGENEKQNSIEYKDILVAGSSESLEDSGMISVVTIEPTEKIFINSFCFGFRLNKDFYDKYDPDFLKHLFRDINFRNEIVSCSFGVTRYNLSKEKFLNIKIPCPPLEIQKEIAKILDKFNDLDVILKEELEVRKEQNEYWQEKLLEEKQSYNTCQLRDIIIFENGKGHEKVVDENGKYILLTSKAISTELEKVRHTDVQLSPLYKDDITMVMSDLPNGRALAKCFYIDEDDKYTLNQRVCRLKVKSEKILPKYLFYQLNRNKQLLEYDNGVDQTNLKKDDILDITVFIPDIKEQHKIVKILDMFEKMIKDNSIGIPGEINLRKRQYEFYRNKLLSFEEV